jgi:hypothetical protein
MSYQNEREGFIAAAKNIGLPVYKAKSLLAHANRIERLAVAICNGDYPADNGERETKQCPQCEGLWFPASFRRGLCPDCNEERMVIDILKGSGIEPIFQGDCRGYTLLIRKLSTVSENENNNPAIGVPAKEV